MTVSFTAPQFTTARRAPARAEVVAHGITTERLADDEALPSGLDRADLGRLGFEARAGQVQVVPVDGRLVAAVGLGGAEGLSSAGLRRAAASLARAVRTRRSLPPPWPPRPPRPMAPRRPRAPAPSSRGSRWPSTGSATSPPRVTAPSTAWPG